MVSQGADPAMPHVAIVGGGYTGAALAIHLMRSVSAPFALTIIDPSDQLGRGIAYGARDPDHRINVPSDRMSLFGDDPDHATCWFFAQGILPDPDSTDARDHHYVPRYAYGGYVGAMLADAIAASRSRVRFVHRHARATDIGPSGDGWSIVLSDGATVVADTVVLCFGHAPPALPCAVDAATRQSPGFVENPWNPDAYASIAKDATVLIVGTGLTMADATASLMRRGHTGTITAISRRALLPQPHGQFADGIDVLEGQPAPRTALALLRLVRGRIAHHGAREGWHPTIDALRAKLPQIWTGLPVAEQRKVVRRLLSFWEVHRFRIAPQIHARIGAARDGARLNVVEAGLVGLERHGPGFAATLRHRSGAVERRCFDAVVLCTGPNKDPGRNALVASLLAQRIARLDAIGQGLAVDPDFRLLDATGRPHPGLLAIGPMVRGSFGEMTGAPDITRHIERVAPRIVVERLA